MLRTAEDALELLNGDSHTAQIRPNTHLIYLNEDRIALKLYDTIIASFRPFGVKINVRGHHTRTTWRRINELTSANTRAKNFLRYFDTEHGPVLYEPGITIDPSGNVVTPMLPSHQRAVEATVMKAQRELRSYAFKAVANWDRGGPVEGTLNARQIVSHIDNGDEPVLTDEMTQYANYSSLQGEELLSLLTKKFRTTLMCEVLPVYVRTKHPTVEFPQVKVPNTEGVPY